MPFVGNRLLPEALSEIVKKTIRPDRDETLHNTVQEDKVLAVP